MHKRKLGALEVSELGFGTLSFASTYGQAPEKAESIRVIRRAIQARLARIEVTGERLPPALLKVTYR
jgi:aryl-alcohol dehydrogenase-like predicted oxidoreductase